MAKQRETSSEPGAQQTKHDQYSIEITIVDELAHRLRWVELGV
jgi:hypothetical protein